MYEYEFVEYIVPVNTLNYDEIKENEAAGFKKIVRCKDCIKHVTDKCQISYWTDKATSDDWYCADGEMDESGWIDPNLCRPYEGTTVLIQINGGQFAGKWEQEAKYENNHFCDQDIILDKEVYGWKYKE